MKILTIIFATMLLTLQYRLWIGDGSMSDLWIMNDAVSAQLNENQILQTRNRSLEAEVKDLKTGDAAIEERARSELGMIGEDETFFQIIDSRSRQQRSGFKRTAYQCKDKEKCILPGFGQ